MREGISFNLHSIGTPSVVSSPYFAWLGTIFIAQTANLTLLNNTFDGVVA